MNILTWIIGLAISAWTGAMGIGAIAKTESAKRWFADMLKQSPALMTINGIGLLIIAALILLNLLFPLVVTSGFVKLALISVAIVQVSSLFMLMRGEAPSAAMAGPIVLLILAVVYWFIRT